MRLFVALRPPTEAVEHLLAALPEGPAAPERWHVTLAFLGEVPDAAPLLAPLDEVGSMTAPFSLSLAGAGSFGRVGPVWVGVGGEVDRLATLARRVRRAARGAGVRLERRPYRPHLTVGRRGTPDPAALQDYSGPSWTAGEVELLRSTLGSTVVHEVLATVDLRGPAPRPRPT